MKDSELPSMTQTEQQITVQTKEIKTLSKMPSSAVLSSAPSFAPAMERTANTTKQPHEKQTTRTDWASSASEETISNCGNTQRINCEKGFEMENVKGAVAQMGERLDDSSGTATRSLWNFASSVTGKGPSFNLLRQNVTSHLDPLKQNISLRLEKLASTDHITSIASSVKDVAKCVQRNAEEMERAILAKANAAENGSVTIENNVILDDVAAGGSMGTAGVTAPKLLHKLDKDVVQGAEEKGKGINDSVGKIDNGLGVDKGLVRVGEMMGTSLGQTVGRFWKSLWGSNDKGKWETVGKEGANNVEPDLQIPTTRFGKCVYDLQGNVNTYCEPADNLDKFSEWGKDFNLNNHTEECIEILSKHEPIAELYERVVPNVIEEDTFWMRYFYAKFILGQEEIRRKRLLDRVEHNVAGNTISKGAWGDDDWSDDDRNVESEILDDDAEIKMSGNNPAESSGVMRSSTVNSAAEKESASGFQGSDADAASKVHEDEVKNERAITPSVETEVVNETAVVETLPVGEHCDKEDSWDDWA